MEIFGKHIFGSDADEFRALPILSQVEWIKKHTKQQNDDAIDDFLSNIPNNNDKNCLNCGENISKRNADEVEAVVENIDTSTNGSKPNSKKRKPAKKS